MVGFQRGGNERKKLPQAKCPRGILASINKPEPALPAFNILAFNHREGRKSFLSLCTFIMLTLRRAGLPLSKTNSPPQASQHAEIQRLKEASDQHYYYGFSCGILICAFNRKIYSIRDIKSPFFTYLGTIVGMNF